MYNLPILLATLLLSLLAIARPDDAQGFRVPIRRVPRFRPIILSPNILSTDVPINNRNELYVFLHCPDRTERQSLRLVHIL